MNTHQDKVNRANHARIAQKPDLIADYREYRIEKIPLNYRITVKKVLKLKNPTYGIDRDCYAPLGYSIDQVHEMAKATIKEYFI